MSIEDPELLVALQKLTDIAETVNKCQHAGIRVYADDWSLLF